MQANEQTKLHGIEALRGVAALLVVLYHAARHLDQAYGTPLLMQVFQPGHGGVDLFFVLSGFIILHVHHQDIGRPGRLGTYAKRRFMRLMPIYWIALALTAASMLAGGKAVSRAFAAWSATLLPTDAEPLLGVAWSLQHELLFYVAFAVLILNARAGLALMGAWLLWMASASAGIGDGTGIARLVSFYNLEFFLGMGAAWLVRFRPSTALVPVVAGAAMLVFNGVCEAMGLIDGYGDMARLTGGLSAAVLIYGLVLLERERPLHVPGFLLALGAASYSIYLFQFLCMGVAWQGWRIAGLDRPDLALPCFAFLALTGVVGGIMISRLIEQPLLARMRRPSKAAPSPAMQGAG